LIVTPAIIGLLTCLLLVSMSVLYASVNGIQIIRGWDLASGTEIQLRLERKTYLVSTLLNFAFSCEVLSLFLFVLTADRLHPLLIGAMCAAGTLNANDYGYWTLCLKIVNVLLCGVWMFYNYVDNRGYDYPLIKQKYAAVLAITVLLLLEGVLFMNYWLRLEPQIITSCCGTIFNDEAETLGGEIAHLPSIPMKIGYGIHFLASLIAGGYFLLREQGAKIFSLLTTTLFVTALLSIVSFIALYFYELPTHHCPFCLLQREYHYVGYPLYGALFVACITGAGVGVIDRYKGRSSIRRVVPAVQKKLCLASLSCHALFALIAIYPMIFSDFILEGY
jgi:hypothetical protein